MGGRRFRTSTAPLDEISGIDKEMVESLFGKPPTQGRDLSRFDDINLLDGEASLVLVGDTVKCRPRSAANCAGDVPATAKIFLRDGEPEAPRGVDDERRWQWQVNLHEWTARRMSPAMLRSAERESKPTERQAQGRPETCRSVSSSGGPSVPRLLQCRIQGADHLVDLIMRDRKCRHET
jgi:hypothetical protein